MPDALLFTVVGYVQMALLLLIPLELYLASRGLINATYDPRDTLANIAVSIGSIVCWGTMSFLLLGVVTAAYQHRLMSIPFTGLTFAIVFVLEDLRYYLWHRISHRVRWFWASHVVHHSSQHFNLSTNLRQSWTSQFSGLILMGVPLAYLGFHPAMVGLAFSLNLVYQFWIHTESVTRLPAWFEWWFNTPSHHRVHHASNPRYLDANYAGVFMIWDRLFGSFVAEHAAEPARYGLVRDLSTFNPLRIAFHEYVAIARDLGRPGLRTGQRLGYLFAPPGWTHAGERHTTRELRELDAAQRGHRGDARPDALPREALHRRSPMQDSSD